jgi:hypothetical protein
LQICPTKTAILTGFLPDKADRLEIFVAISYSNKNAFRREIAVFFMFPALVCKSFVETQNGG